MHDDPLIIARDEWLQSPEGLRCLDPTNFLRKPSDAEYLRNRLFLAFIAGADAQRKIDDDAPIVAEDHPHA